MSVFCTTDQNRWLRLGVGVFLVLTCLKVWLGPIAIIPEAAAQIPDAGLQRKQLIDETRRSNELLGDIKRILEDQTLNVRVRSADNQADAPIKTPVHGH